jgi:hypothetical protein
MSDDVDFKIVPTRASPVRLPGLAIWMGRKAE